MPISKQEYYDLLVRTSADGRFPDKRYEGLVKKANTNAEEFFRDNELSDLIPEGMTIHHVRRVQSIHDNMVQYMEDTPGLKWKHEQFVEGLNRLPFFVSFAHGEPGKAD